MNNSKLVYTDDLDSLVRIAKESGLSIQAIVIKITQGRSYDETRKIGEKWHQALGIKLSKFMYLSRGRYW